MLFLRAGEDFVPYTPRDKQNLHENLQGLGPGIQAESLELAIRKEVRVSGSEEALPAGRPQAAELRRWPPAQLCCPPLSPLLGRAAVCRASSREARRRAGCSRLCLPGPLSRPAHLLHTQHPHLAEECQR